MITLERWLILTTLQKLPKNVGDLGKLIVAKGFKKWPKVQYSPNLVTLLGNDNFYRTQAQHLSFFMISLHLIDQTLDIEFVVQLWQQTAEKLAKILKGVCLANSILSHR